MDKISVLISYFNEASVIRKVVCDFKQAIPDANIYVYDNNSTDGTSTQNVSRNRCTMLYSC